MPFSIIRAVKWLAVFCVRKANRGSFIGIMEAIQGVVPGRDVAVSEGVAVGRGVLVGVGVADGLGVKVGVSEGVGVIVGVLVGGLPKTRK